MKQGYYILEHKDLEFTNIKLVNCSFSNTIETISGVCNNCIIACSTQEQYISINSIIKGDASVKIFYTDDINKFLIIDGIIARKQSLISDQAFAFSIGITHKTYRMQKIPTPPFANFNKTNAKETILNLLKLTKCNKLYDNIIMPFKNIKSAKFQKIIDNNKNSGSNQSVYKTLALILNDIDVKIFTTTINNKTVLYLYDTGVDLDTIPQSINNDNLIDFNYDIDYNKLITSASIKSEAGISPIIDFKQVGQEAQWGTAQSSNNATIKSINSFGIRNLRTQAITDLPELIFNKTLTTSSTTGDIKEYTNMLIRESLNDGIVIVCKVINMFIDWKNPSRGIWQLGSRIAINNALLINLLKAEFTLYLRDNDKYFFIIKAIQSDNKETKLILGLSDLIRKFN